MTLSTTSSRDARALAITAAACAALVFVVVASSAWLRLSAPDACPPAGCEGFTLADVVRLAHRIAAMGVSVLVLLIAALAWRPPVSWSRRLAAAGAIVLVVVLSIVGRHSAGSAAAAIVLTNLLGGMALLGLTAWMAAVARYPGNQPATAAHAATILLAAAIATGAVVTARATGENSAAAMLHRALAWLAMVAWAWLATSPRPATAAVFARLAAAALAVQVVLALNADHGPVTRWLHNVLSSASLVAAVVATRAARRGEPTPARDPHGEAAART